jgi:hypothetical protein
MYVSVRLKNGNSLKNKKVTKFDLVVRGLDNMHKAVGSIFIASLQQKKTLKTKQQRRGQKKIPDGPSLSYGPIYICWANG